MNKSLKIPTTVIKNSKGMIGLFFNRYDRLQDDNEDIRFDGENLYLGERLILDIDKDIYSYIKSGQTYNNFLLNYLIKIDAKRISLILKEK